MTDKGMSQVLALIVAASVLMMTALILIFMVQGGLDFSNVDRTSCTTTATTQCSANPGGQIVTPATCLNNEDSLPNGLKSSLEAKGSIKGASTGGITCASP